MSNSGPGSRAEAQFGPYRLVRLLGRGRAGEVYQAERVTEAGDHSASSASSASSTSSADSAVALKLFGKRFSGSPVFRLRMQREAEVAGLLTEPHLVPIQAFGEVDGTVYTEMRLVEGTDLATLLRSCGPLSPARAVAIVGQVAAALDAAHSVGVLHRDVKPENILIADRGGDDFACLTDVGITRATAEPELTQVGTAVKMFNYMAPERFTGDPVTHLTDVYALTGVLSECLTGSPPYPAHNIEQALGAHLTAPPPQPSRLQPGRVPEPLDAVIARGMAKRPEDRYRSAGALAAAARDALTNLEPDTESAGETASRPAFVDARLAPALPEPLVGPPPEPPIPAARPWRKRRPVLVGAAALVAVVVAAVGYLGTRPSRASSVAAPAQSVLPFSGLDYRLSPDGVAVDADGAVYVTSQGMNGHVLKLPAGSSEPAVLPFAGLHQPQGVAVDGAGTVYVSDFGSQVVRLASGSKNQVVLPFGDLDDPVGVAADVDGNVYIADRGNDRVVRLAAGTNVQTVLPFGGLDHPYGVAVDGAGGVYVTDTGNNRVLKLASGSAAQTVLPFTGIVAPAGISVDSTGGVYVTERDSGKVAKLAAGSAIPAVLPFTELNAPLGVVVDKQGNVYVADRGNDRVVTVPG